MKPTKSILLVDDVPDVLEAIKIGLQSSSKYDFQIQQAKNPRDYLRQNLQGQRFDVSIVDLQLEEGKSLAFPFLGMLMTRTQEHPGSIFVVYSGYPQMKNVIKAMQLGASDFKHKLECPPHELVKYIEGLFDEQKRSWERHLELEELNRTHYHEWKQKYAGQHIALVGKEVVVSASSRLKAVLDYDDLRMEHPDWPEMPDLIEVIK